MFDFGKIADAEKMLRDFMSEVLTRLRELDTKMDRLQREVNQLKTIGSNEHGE